MTALRTMADVRRANAALGHHWFSPDTMRFFASRIESPLYLATRSPVIVDGTPVEVAGYFIHSRQFTSSTGESYPRTFHIAAVSPRGDVNPRGYAPSPFPDGYATLNEAAAATLALLA